MIKSAILSSIVLGSCAAIALMATPARAEQTITVTRIVKELSDFPALKTAADAVCKGNAKLSDKARAVCDGKAPFPSVTKAGAFRNAGVGAEFNALIRQN
jgi:hypothetical protein